MRERLAGQLATARRRKAIRCAELAMQHGARPSAVGYRDQWAFWLRAADIAASGDLTPLAYSDPRSWDRLNWLEDHRKHG